MALVRTIAGRSLRQRRARTVFSALGIGVGIATVVAVFTLDHNTMLARGSSGGGPWQAEIAVSPSQLADDPRLELAELPGITGVTASFQSDVHILRSDEPRDGEGRRIHFAALEPERAAALGAYRVERGGDLAGSDAREVLLGGELAASLGIDIGQEVVLKKPLAAARRECVDGVWQEREDGIIETDPGLAFTVVGLLAREGIGRRSRGEVALVHYEQGRRLFEDAHVQTQYWLQHEGSLDLEELQASLGKAYSYELRKSVIVGQAADERAFRNGVRFAGLFALVLGLFVIFHTLSMSLLERSREVGVLHALGASKRQVARIFLWEAAFIAFAGGALGLLGGLGLARFLLKKGVSTIGLGHPIRMFDVPWRVTLTLCLLGISIAMLGSVFPLLRAGGTRVSAILRGERPDTRAHMSLERGFRIFTVLLLVGLLPGMYFAIVPVVGRNQGELLGVVMIGLGVLALLVALPLCGPSLFCGLCARVATPIARVGPLVGLLARRSMSQSPARVAGGVAAMALVTAAFVGLRGMTRSLEAEIEVWGREASLNKVFLRNLGNASFDELASALKRYPGVLGVEPGDARTYVPFLLIGVRVDQLDGYGPCSEDPALLEELRSGRGVVLSRRLANHGDYQIGSPVHVTTSRGEVKTLRVSAISDSYGYFPHPDERLYGVVSDAFLHENFCIDVAHVSTASVRLAPGTPTSVVETAVHEALQGRARVTIETGRWIHRWHTSDIRRDFILFDIILALTAVLAGLGILNGQLLSALERSKELGVLKALGTSRSQVAGAVLAEAGTIGLVGGGLGLLIGLVLTPVIVGSLQVISSLPLPTRSAGIWCLWAWLGALVVAAMAGLYPIWRMNRQSALSAVRTGG